MAAAQAMVELAKKPSAVAQAKGKLEAAKPVLARAKELYEIGKKLSEDGAIAIAELKRRETAMQSAAADVLTAQAAVAQAEAQQQRDLKAATAGETAAQAALEQARAQQQGDLKAAEALEEAIDVKSLLTTEQMHTMMETFRMFDKTGEGNIDVEGS